MRPWQTLIVVAKLGVEPAQTIADERRALRIVIANETDPISAAQGVDEPKIVRQAQMPVLEAARRLSRLHSGGLPPFHKQHRTRFGKRLSHT